MVKTMAKLCMAHASTHGARMAHAWRTQAAWANYPVETLPFDTLSISECELLICVQLINKDTMEFGGALLISELLTRVCVYFLIK